MQTSCVFCFSSSQATLPAADPALADLVALGLAGLAGVVLAAPVSVAPVGLVDLAECLPAALGLAGLAAAPAARKGSPALSLWFYRGGRKEQGARRLQITAALRILLRQEFMMRGRNVSASGIVCTIKQRKRDTMQRRSIAKGVPVFALALAAASGANAQQLGKMQLQLQPRVAQLQAIGAIPQLVPVHIRLGAEVSPRVKFDGGIDFTIPGLHISPRLSTRIDLDAVVSANFGRVTTLFPLTIDEIYSPQIIGLNAFYAGVGIGPYLGERTRFGGKILAGATLAHSIGLEGTMHFAGFGDPLFTLQLRFPLGR